MTNFFDYRPTCRLDNPKLAGRDAQGWSGIDYFTKQEVINYIQQMIDSGDAEDGDYDIGYFSTDENGDDYLINSVEVNFEDEVYPWSLSDFDGSYTSMRG